MIRVNSVSKILTVVTFSLTASVLTEASAYGNVVGSDMQNFNPTPDGLDFVTVNSSETLAPGFINFGLFLNYAVNTLPYFEDDSKFQSRTLTNDTLLGADLNVGVGVTNNWQLGLSLPQVISQSVDYQGQRGQFVENGSTEVRISSKYRIWGDDKVGIAAVGSVNINRVDNNPYTGAGAPPVWNGELAWSRKLFGFSFGLNAGYRHRVAGEQVSPVIQPMRSQYIESGAVSYHIEAIDSKIIFEVFASQPVQFQQDYSSRLGTSSEAILGIKYDISNSTALHTGMGTSIERGQSSPDWRSYAGVNYQMGPTWNEARVTEEVTKTTSTEAVEKLTFHDILFEFRSDHLVLVSSRERLDQLAQKIVNDPSYKKIVIIGHTDSIGAAEFNLDLSQRRAESIKLYLIKKHGIEPGRIVAEGHGKGDPIADNGNYQGRQLNRRAEFQFFRN